MQINSFQAQCRYALAFLVVSTFSFAYMAATVHAQDNTQSLAQAVIAATTPDPLGKSPLPLETILDSVRMEEGIWIVDLTLPMLDSSNALTFGGVERAHALFAGAMDPQRLSRGLQLKARIGQQGVYAPIESYCQAPQPQVEREVREATSPVSAKSSGVMQFSSPISGPIGHVGTQPAGALSGVTVFCAAGHGWTAGTSAWFLQRPFLLDMVEDYGNLDQLNYFVQHLYNAGATVVPFRPVGYQNIEIVLDNDDAGVTYSGAWANSDATTEYYENGTTLSGVPYRYATASPTETSVARYTPMIPLTGFYPVYCWTRDGDDRVRQTYRITHSGGTASMVIDHRMIGKGWIWLGNYHFLAGADGYVEITNAALDSGVVIADAIRFGNGIGDIVRPGPNTISGFSREEECMRYWAESEAGNHAVGMSSTIWDQTDVDDQGDNTGTGARWAAAMNRQSYNNDRWRRVYLDFHTNAAGCGQPTCDAQGELCLISTSATTNQAVFAAMLSSKVDSDMMALSSQFLYPWVHRGNTLTGAYGSIATYNNDNEFDATLIEIAFHDNVNDAANLVDPRVRNAVARSVTQGIIKFLNSLSGSTVPLIYPPETPDKVRAQYNSSNGAVTVSWAAPPSGGTNGHAATGYRIYRSSNGYGYDSGISTGNVLSYTLTDIPQATTTYIRVAATNAGGESMPSEVVAIRTPAYGDWKTRVLIVSGYDLVSSAQCPTQVLPVGTIKRQITSRINSYDYMIQHASAVSAAGMAFDSSSNEAVENGSVSLASYDAVLWFCGNEYTPEITFSAAEQAIVTAYLNGGGRIFVSGAHIATDLDNQNRGRTFYQNVLGARYQTGSAGTSRARGKASTILSDVAQFTFGTGDAPYTVSSSDVILPQTGGSTILEYVGRTITSAGVAFTTPTYKTVVFGPPFESITPASTRNAIMVRVLDHLIGHKADFDRDGDVDAVDFDFFSACYNGPVHVVPSACSPADFNKDTHVDAADFDTFNTCYNGPNRPPKC